MALIVYREIPGVTAYSPPKLLLATRIQMQVLKLEDLSPEWPSYFEGQGKDAMATTRWIKSINHRLCVCGLPSLMRGEGVWVQDISSAVKVLSPVHNPRYMLLRLQQASFATASVFDGGDHFRAACPCARNALDTTPRL